MLLLFVVLMLSCHCCYSVVLMLLCYSCSLACRGQCVDAAFCCPLFYCLKVKCMSSVRAGRGCGGIILLVINFFSRSVKYPTWPQYKGTHPLAASLFLYFHCSCPSLHSEDHRTWAGERERGNQRVTERMNIVCICSIFFFSFSSSEHF